MRISDWSSDVCSFDLERQPEAQRRQRRRRRFEIGIAVDQPAGTERFEALAQQRRPGLGELPADFLRDPGIAERALQRHLRQVAVRSEEHTSELQSLMRTSYAVFCLKKKTNKHNMYCNPAIERNAKQ